MSAQQQHADLVRIAATLDLIVTELERIADSLDELTSGDKTFAVRQSGAWITREDRP